MKHLFTLLVIIILGSSAYGQTWMQKASLPDTTAGYWPISFSIGGKLYVGGGYWNGTVLNTFYEYNPATNLWTKKGNLPLGLYSAACFVINGKGYVACGGQQGGFSSSVYLYDPAIDTWTAKNNFSGTARYNTVGFSLNGKGYMYAGFTGGSNVNKEMWEYDTINDTWTQKANSPGQPRNSPVALTISGQAYVGLGSDVHGNTFYSDFYRFDPVANSYTTLQSSPVGRNGAAHFVIDSIGYIGLGLIDSMGINTTAQDFTTYTPSTNLWSQVNSFGGVQRSWVFSETIGSVPYIGGGSSVLTQGHYYHDMWSLSPTGVEDINTTLSSTLVCYPSPTSGSFVIDATGYESGDKQVTIYDQLGQLVYQNQSSEDKVQINTRLAQGVYNVMIADTKKKGYAKIAVE